MQFNLATSKIPIPQDFAVVNSFKGGTLHGT